MIKISPSVLACDFSRMAEEVDRVEKGGAEYLHLDVMDGIFVPNISFGAPVISSLRPHSKLVFDTHLMIVNPERYIDDFVKAGSDIITIHYESTDKVLDTLKYIRSNGIKAGITIKPATPVSVLNDLVDYVDMILIMSVEPGFGGQAYIESSDEKIRQVKELVERSGKHIDIEVDGGVSPSNVKRVIDAGANVIVAGSAIFKSQTPDEVIKLLRG